MARLESDAAKAKMRFHEENTVFEMKTQGAKEDRKHVEQPKVSPHLVMPVVLPYDNNDFATCRKFLVIEKERQDGILIAIC